ncbi:hypothetical protein DXG03_002021, partial [Asterophora parasitica]
MLHMSLARWVDGEGCILRVKGQGSCQGGKGDEGTETVRIAVRNLPSVSVDTLVEEEQEFSMIPNSLPRPIAILTDIETDGDTNAEAGHALVKDLPGLQPIPVSTDSN